MPTILLAQEDAASREKFASLILDFFPTANVQPVETWEELEPVLAKNPASTVLLADIFWQETDRSADLLLLAEGFPEVPLAVFSRYDLTGSLPPGYPIPLVAPDENLPLRLSENMENISGRTLGPYVVSAPAGPHRLGRLYWAKHHQLQRSTQILVPPAGSAVFPKAIRTMARVNHPSVYSLYESLPWGNRILVAQEPVLHPSLVHLRLAGHRPGLLPCARLVTVLGSVLAEMESSAVAPRLLGEYDYTLSPHGIPRLRNPAAYPGIPEASAHENARQLAGYLEPILQGQPRGDALLEILRNPGSSAFDLHRRAREFENRLAEVRQVHVRQEEVEAARKVLRARVIRRWSIAGGVVLTLAFVALYARVLFQKFLLDLPARLPEAERAVPAGKIQRDGETIPVPAFFLDRHEVTIGDYEKFLAAIREDPAWQRFLPENSFPKEASPADLEPRDWTEILRRARKYEPYQQQKISRDTPVFNVDYRSATAYAKWKGRRLPTMDEWLLAAGGHESRPFPWGSHPDPAGANLGVTREEQTGRDRGDSFFNAAPGESMPVDCGPYGHFDLGGNVSEWAVGPSQKPVALGGNFTDPRPIPLDQARRQDANRQDPSAKTRLEMIGFRTAR